VILDHNKGCAMLKSKAEAIALTVLRKGNHATDPTVIISAISEIILAIVQLYKNCNKTPEQAVQDMQSISAGGLLGFFQRRRLWKIIGKHKNIPQHEVYDAMLNAGKSINISEVSEIYSEA